MTIIKLEHKDLLSQQALNQNKQKMVERRDATALTMPEPYLTRVRQEKQRQRAKESLANKLAWTFLAVVFLYFAMHVTFWAIAGFPMRGM